MTPKNLFFIACLCSALSVVLGAFGAHGLKALITPEQLQTFEIGVRYQFYHSFALFCAAFIWDKYGSDLARIAAYLFMGGMLCFCGSLYLLANRFWLGVEAWTWLGPITPLGGMLFIAAWGCLAAACKTK
jgi:uncharacterized membrane protein YgdD (TMEM256/DUF423 family)